MKKVNFFMAMLVVFTSIYFGVAHSNESTIDKIWNERVKIADKILSKTGLDSCDRAIENAYKNVNLNRRNGNKVYELNIKINKKNMKVGFSYIGESLDSFLLFNIPQYLIVVQKSKSKTLTVLNQKQNCAFDICTNNPTLVGPCV